MFHRPTSHSPAIGPGCAGPSLSIPTSAVLDHAGRVGSHVPVAGAPAFAVDPQLCGAASGEPRKHTQCVPLAHVAPAVFRIQPCVRILRCRRDRVATLACAARTHHISRAVSERLGHLDQGQGAEASDAARPLAQLDLVLPALWLPALLPWLVPPPDPALLAFTQSFRSRS